MMLATLAVGLSIVALCSYALDLRMAYIEPMRRLYRGMDVARREHGYDPYNTQSAYSPWANVEYADLGDLMDLEATVELAPLVRVNGSAYGHVHVPYLDRGIPADPQPWLTDFTYWLERDET